MALRGRVGAHVTHSRHNSKELTKAGQKAFLAKFELEVDPDGVLDLEERRRRATHALKAHMARLAIKSANARRNSESSLVPGAPALK